MKQKLEQYQNQTMIFIHFKFDQAVDAEIWIESFQSFFDAHTGFFMTDKSGFFLKSALEEDFASKLDEVIEIMSFDFSTKAQFSIGLPQRIHSNIETILQKEHTLFLNSKSIEPLISLTQDYVNTHFTNLLDSPVFETLKHYIHTNQDMGEAIVKLFETNNNVAQSAAELYLHRNTLIYRMNKFEKDTQMDLKNPHNLLICYLITREEIK